MRSPNASIAFINELEDVGLILLLEPGEHRVTGVGCPSRQKFGLEPFGARRHEAVELNHLIRGDRIPRRVEVVEITQHVAAGIARESIYRMLTDKGNPTYSSLVGILRALGLKVAIEPEEAQTPKPCSKNLENAQRTAGGLKQAHSGRANRGGTKKP